MKNIVITINKMSMAGKLISAIFVVALLGIIDKSTGYDVSFSIFYLIPIIFTVWFVNRTAAYVICLLSALSWLSADIYSGHVYANYWIPIWNSAMRLMIFIFIVYILNRTRTMLIFEQKIARLDDLTKAANSRSFNEILGKVLERNVLIKEPFTISYMDIDNFKQLNDTFGHSIGDDVLIKVAETIMNSIRDCDFVARLGGDEFAMLFPKTSTNQAGIIIKRIQEKLLEEAQRNHWPITFSIGILTYENGILKNPNDVIKAADALMYTAKEKGKNKLIFKIMNG